MRILIIIAWRNLWRNPRRTLLTALTVALGLGLLLLFLGIGDGSHLAMIENAVRLGSAHVGVQTRGYQELGGIDRVLSAQEVEQVHSWLSLEGRGLGVETVLPRVFASGLASSADGATGVRVIGLDPDREVSPSFFDDKITVGEFLSSSDQIASVIGDGVARKLHLAPGGKFVLMAQAANSMEIESLLLRVSGVMRTGLEDFDQATVLLPLATAQRLLKLEGRLHQVAIMLDDVEQAARVAERGRAKLPSSVEVLDWTQLMPELRDFIRIDDGGSYVFNGLFFLIIAFMVANTLLMSVMERRREFALLDALGFSPRRRFVLVILEASWIAALSVIVGTALGYAGHLYFHHHGLPLAWFYSSEVSAGGAVLDPIIYSELTWRRIAGAAVIVFGLTFVLSLLPAWRGARAEDVHLLGQL